MDDDVKILDETLSVRKGHLYAEECDTVELVEKFGSPIFVLSEKMLRSNIQRFKKAFQNNWPEGKVTIMPAI